MARHFSRLCEPAADCDCVVESLAWTEVVRSPRESQQTWVYKGVEGVPGLMMRARLCARSPLLCFCVPKAGPSCFVSRLLSGSSL